MNSYRIKKAEIAMELKEERRPQMPDFENMSPELLDSFLLKGLKNEIKQIKNICDHENISLKNREGFIEGLRIYREKFCSTEEKKFYSDELIELLGSLYDEHKDELNPE